MIVAEVRRQSTSRQRPDDVTLDTLPFPLAACTILLRSAMCRYLRSNTCRGSVTDSTPGRLIIDVSESSGPRFDVQIDRQGSTGVDHMAIFAFDVAVADAWSKDRPSPGFLVHDSEVFDGVDERQLAVAMTVAQESAARHGYQYIGILNSDDMPTEDLPNIFDINSYTRLHLSDEGDAGTLLGFRF
jgi:uncharacterized protein YydD (DUF2326 family)